MSWTLQFFYCVSCYHSVVEDKKKDIFINKEGSNW